MNRILARTQKVVHDPDGMILGRKASNPMRHVKKLEWLTQTAGFEVFHPELCRLQCTVKSNRMIVMLQVTVLLWR